MQRTDCGIVDSSCRDNQRHSAFLTRGVVRISFCASVRSRQTHRLHSHGGLAPVRSFSHLRPSEELALRQSTSRAIRSAIECVCRAGNYLQRNAGLFLARFANRGDDAGYRWTGRTNNKSGEDHLVLVIAWKSASVLGVHEKGKTEAMAVRAELPPVPLDFQRSEPISMVTMRTVASAPLATTPLSIWRSALVMSRRAGNLFAGDAKRFRKEIVGNLVGFLPLVCVRDARAARLQQIDRINESVSIQRRSDRVEQDLLACAARGSKCGSMHTSPSVNEPSYRSAARSYSRSFQSRRGVSMTVLAAMRRARGKR